jgi:hypothetical protein
MLQAIKRYFRNSLYAALASTALMVSTAIWGPSPLDHWAVNFWLWVDQGANSMLFLGDPQETISSRAGKWYVDGESWTRRNTAWVLCGFLDVFDTNHCEDSVNEHVGDKAVVR